VTVAGSSAQPTLARSAKSILLIALAQAMLEHRDSATVIPPLHLKRR
jgi:hypothetical protein